MCPRRGIVDTLAQGSQIGEIRTRDFFDLKLGLRLTSTSYTLSRPEARIAIYGDRGILTVEASLPKLLYGNNLNAVNDADRALRRLGEFVSDYVEGDIPDLAEMDYLRVDYCHNFQVGSATSRTVNRRRRKKTMTRRTGQNGTVELRNRVWRGRYLVDVAGRAQRQKRSVWLGLQKQTTKSEARRKLKEIIHAEELNSPTYVIPATESLSEIVERWEVTYLSKRKPSTQATMRYHLDKYLSPKWGKTPVDHITAEAVRRVD